MRVIRIGKRYSIATGEYPATTDIREYLEDKLEKKFYEERKLIIPKRCKLCSTLRKNILEKKRADEEKIEWQKKEDKKIEYYMNVLSFKFKDIDRLYIPIPEQTSYIIGNGFDLMHGVQSSYYNFRDFLGERSELKKQLEQWSLKADLWSDFENNLAYMDDEDFLAADFFCAAEECVYPLRVIQNELSKRLRQWINSLQCTNNTKPLVPIIQKEGRYINFNYTEFLESIYDVAMNSILYIHGDRRNEN